MARRPSVNSLRRRANKFLRLKGWLDLARHWRVDPVRMAVMAEEPKYRRYRIPKKTAGTFRQIEDPEPHLKALLRKLNRDLQAVYYFQRSPAAYGFLVNPTDDPDPRNILSNAQRHLGCDWLMNLDMRDFFHLIDREDVEKLFRMAPFNFPKLTARRLGGLCTYEGRLPMGAPTSPILSNYYSHPLDVQLEKYAASKEWTYTRFADDITFSSRQTPIFYEDLYRINDWVENFDLALNPTKSVIHGPDRNDKEVTGLVVGDTQVHLSAEFLEKVRTGIKQLDAVINTKYLMPSGRRKTTAWVKEVEQRVRGLVQFAQKVLPDDDPLQVELENDFEEALEPPRRYGPVSWLEFGYLNFSEHLPD
ncbi:MAG: reverse transcriptase family protein [Bacteroidota bacterium]